MGRGGGSSSPHKTNAGGDLKRSLSQDSPQTSPTALSDSMRPGNESPRERMRNPMFNTTEEDSRESENEDSRRPLDSDVSDAKSMRSYLEKEIYGSHLEDDKRQQELERKLKSDLCGFLHPDTAQTAWWEIGQMVVLGYYTVVLPYDMAFDVHVPTFSLKYCTNVFADFMVFLDIILNLIRYGEVDERVGSGGDDLRDLETDGTPRQTGKRNAEYGSRKHREDLMGADRSQYLRSWFAADALSIFPADWIYRMVYGRDDEIYRSPRLLRLLRMLRAARFLKMFKTKRIKKAYRSMLRFLESKGISRVKFDFWIRLLTLLLGLTVAMHLSSCAIIGTGKDFFTDHITSESSKPQWDQYSDACYFMLVTFSSVGYGDLTPSNTHSRRVMMTFIVIGLFAFSYIVGVFSLMVANMQRDSTEYDAKIRSIKALMKHISAPPSLQRKVFQYYSSKYNTKTLFDHDKVYKELPARLRVELMVKQFQHIIARVPFFQGVSRATVIEICALLHTFPVIKGDLIMQKGEESSELFILIKGLARVLPGNAAAVFNNEPDLFDISEERMEHLVAEARTLDNTFELGSGSVLGELEFLGVSDRRTISVVTTSYCDIATLSPDDMTPVLSKNVKLRRRLHTYGLLKAEMGKYLQEVSSGERAEPDAAELQEFKTKLQGGFDERKELHDAFNYYDKDGSGEIDRDELTSLMEELQGSDFTSEDIDYAMKLMDVDSGGTVCYSEFESWWMSTGGSFVGSGGSSLKYAAGDKQAKAMRALKEQVKGMGARLDGVERAMQEQSKATAEILQLLRGGKGRR